MTHEEETSNFLGLGDDFDDDCDLLDCYWCGGEGWVEGDDPLWDEGEWVECPSCHGSGRREDMTLG